MPFPSIRRRRRCAQSLQRAPEFDGVRSRQPPFGIWHLRSAFADARAADAMTTMSDLRAEALVSKAWPYEEARKLLKRYPDGKPGGEAVLFETGYGPSGLPHIGTFNEVLRTTMVRNAFHTLSDQPTRLIAFSDDMDGLRKVPDNVPNKAMLAEHLGKPLTRIPDPFDTHESFAHHQRNAARLPRSLRLRLRIRLVHRLLHVRPFR